MDASNDVRHLLGTGTRYRGKCPFCNHPNSFSASKENGKIKWYCFYALCKAKGVTGVDRTLQELKQKPEPPKDFEIPKRFTQLNDRCIKEIYKKNCGVAYEHGMFHAMYDPKMDRLAFIKYDNHVAVGAIGRTLSGQQPKWYKYPNSREMPFICGVSKRVVIVEDCFSACAVAPYISGMALEGTKYHNSFNAYVRRYETAYIALDKDASRVSIDLSKRLSYMVPTKVVFLDTDVKDMMDVKSWVEKL